MPAPPCENYGDVNGDGNVSALDIQLIEKHVLGMITLTPDQIKRADVNGDGVATMADAQLITKYVVGEITTFPVCGVTPPPSDCPWDLNGDGVVDDADHAWLTDHWGPCTPGSKGDFNGDGVIDMDDLIIIGQHYGPCPGVTPPPPPPPPPNMETRTVALEIGKSYQIVVSLSGYDTLNATINVSSVGITCTVGPCNTQGPPGVTTSGWTVTTYLKAGTVATAYTSWVSSKGGASGLRKNLSAIGEIIDGFLSSPGDSRYLGFDVSLANVGATIDYFLG